MRREEEEVVESQKGGEECGKSTKVTESMHGRGRERRRAGEGIGRREQEGGGGRYLLAKLVATRTLNL